jgi:hypothetical protein
MSNFSKELHFSLHDKLHSLDTESQTFGCRHSNPDICGSCYINNICAFSSDDNICKKPSAKWKKVYRSLKTKEEE